MVVKRQSIWMMENFPKLKDFLYVIKDEHHKDIVEQVLDAFQRRVIPNINEYEQGVIYGDFNEHNIIVNKKSSNVKEYEITGIIDFGDVCYSRYVFELAIAMAYMILEANDINTGGLVIAGYSMIRLIPLHEKEILRVSCLKANSYVLLLMSNFDSFCFCRLQSLRAYAKASLWDSTRLLSMQAINISFPPKLVDGTCWKLFGLRVIRTFWSDGIQLPKNI